MAFNSGIEQARKLTFQLSDKLYNSLNSLVALKRQERAKKEARFQQAVADGLSYEEQASFLESQILEEKKQGVPDQEAIDNWTTDLKNARSLAKFTQARNEYYDVYDSYKQNKTTASKVIKVLEKQLQTITDPKQREEIRNDLSQMRQASIEDEKNMFENRIQLAKNDGSQVQLDNMIKEVEAKKRQAIIDGSDTTIYDLQMQNLKSEKTKIGVNTKNHDLEVTMNNIYNPHQKLQAVMDQVSMASNDPFTDPKTGIKYNSEKSYWQEKVGDYISNTFFKDLEQYNNDWIETVSQKNVNGWVPVLVSDTIKKQGEDYMSDPTFAPYADKLTSVITNGLNKAAQQQANAALASASVDLDFDGAKRTIEGIIARTGATNLQQVLDQVEDLRIQRSRQVLSSEDVQQLMQERGIQLPSDTSSSLSQEELQKQNTYEGQFMKQAARQKDTPQFAKESTVQGFTSATEGMTPQNINQVYGSSSQEQAKTLVDSKQIPTIQETKIETEKDLLSRYDSIKSMVDQGGDAIKLDETMKTNLAKNYNYVPGLQEYIDKTIQNFEQTKGGVYTDAPTISSTKVKQLVGSAALPIEDKLLKQSGQQPVNIDEFNKKLRKEQGRM